MLSHMKKFIAALALCLDVGLAFAQSAPVPTVTQQQATNPSRVLFVGNSYFYYNDSLHNTLRKMLAAHDAAYEKSLQYKSSTIGGSSLHHHNIDWLTTPGRIGVELAFQLVVIAGNSADALSAKGQAEFRSAATEAAKTIRSRGGQVAIYMVHAYVKPHRQARPDNIRKIEQFYIEMANELNALVIPVGLAFEEAYKRFPDMILHQHYDGSHPSPAGTYLAAATAMATLYGISPVGNSFDAYGKVDAATRAKLQQVAQDVVMRVFGRK
jgi:hypothetical protein